MILGIYSKRLVQLILRKPVPRFIYGGPIVMTNFYRANWNEEILKFIISSIYNKRDETVSVLDLFNDEPVVHPFRSDFKGENLFEKKRKTSNWLL